MSHIPRRVVHTLFGFDTIPEKWKAGYESVDRMMPSYNHSLLHGDEYDTFVKTHFPHFFETFRSYEFEIQRCDAIRYMLLYVHGGVYIDLDIEIMKDLTPLLEGCDLAIAEDLEGTFFTHSNSLMASRPRHPFWLECIALMKARAKNEYLFQGLNVVMKTGPGIVSEVFRRYAGSVRTLPRRYVNPGSLCNRQPVIPKEAYVRPIQDAGGTWIPPWQKIMVRVWCKRRAVFTLLILVLSFVVLKHALKLGNGK